MIHVLVLLFLLISLILNFFLLNISPIFGIFVSTFSIIIYLILSIYDFYDIYAQDILAIFPTFIFINLVSMYFHISDQYTNTLAIYLILFLISIIFSLKIFHEKKIFNFTNLKHSYSALLGIGLGYVIYYFIPFSSFSVSKLDLLGSLGLIVLIAISESIFFQALIQNAVTKMTEPIIGVIFTSILYGLFHFSNNIFYTALFIILNLMYSTVYAVWKNIYIIIGLNLITSLTFYFLTSHLLVFAIK